MNAHRVDDIDGTCADETVTFGIDGSTYEIDLGFDNAAKLRSVVRAWAAAARPGQEPPARDCEAEVHRLYTDRIPPNAVREHRHNVGERRDSEEQLSIVADRDRIAHDLHDHVIQQLFAAGMSLQGTIARAYSPVVVTDRLRRTVDDLQDIVDDIRAAIYRLQLPVARTGDFRRRIQRVVTELTADSPMRTTLHTSGPMVVIGTVLAGHAEAVTREAVSNAVRHSGATCLHIEITVSDHLVIDVVDDGCGIPANSQRRSGLANLCRRAALVGGQCQITTAPGGGTQVRWSAPYSVLGPNSQQDSDVF